MKVEQKSAPICYLYCFLLFLWAQLGIVRWFINFSLILLTSLRCRQKDKQGSWLINVMKLRKWKFRMNFIRNLLWCNPLGWRIISQGGVDLYVRKCITPIHNVFVTDVMPCPSINQICLLCKAQESFLLKAILMGTDLRGFKIQRAQLLKILHPIIGLWYGK